jgi:hypothetical protein
MSSLGFYASSYSKIFLSETLVHGHANPVNLIDQRFNTPTKCLPLVYHLCE